MMSFFPVTKTTIKKFHLQLKYSELHVNSELVSTLISSEVCSNAPFPFYFHIQQAIGPVLIYRYHLLLSMPQATLLVQTQLLHNYHLCVM